MAEDKALGCNILSFPTIAHGHPAVTIFSSPSSMASRERCDKPFGLLCVGERRQRRTKLRKSMTTRFRITPLCRCDTCNWKINWVASVRAIVRWRYQPDTMKDGL